MDVLHERGEARNRVVLRRKCIIVESPGEIAKRPLLQVLEDPVADLHWLGQRVEPEFGAKPREILFCQLVLANRLGVGQVVPLAVVRTLDAELRLEDRAVLEVALENLLEERHQALVLVLRRRGLLRSCCWQSRIGCHENRGRQGRDNSPGQIGHQAVSVHLRHSVSMNTAIQVSGWQCPSQRTTASSQRAAAVQTLNRKCMTSPSRTTYSLPSSRSLPASRAPASPSLRCSHRRRSSRRE